MAKLETGRCSLQVPQDVLVSGIWEAQIHQNLFAPPVSLSLLPLLNVRYAEVCEKLLHAFPTLSQSPVCIPGEHVS